MFEGNRCAALKYWEKLYFESDKQTFEVTLP